MVRIKWKNAKGIIADLNRFENALGKEQVEYFNQAIPESFYDFNKGVFESEGGKGGHGKWSRLSPKYKKWKEKKYPGKTIMRRTDRLFDSLTKGTKDSVQFIGNVGKKLYIRIGTQVPYAIYHQEGQGYLPVRRTIDPTQSLLLSWLKVVHQAYVYAARYGPWAKGWKIPIPKWDSKKVN